MKKTAKAKDIVRMLKKAGYKEIRCHGSHHTFCNPNNGRKVTIAYHSTGADLGRGTLRDIYEKTGLEF